MAQAENPYDHANVMLSSTFADLAKHRDTAVDALLRLGFFPIGMEFDSAKSGTDIIESSFGMVDRARVYVGILSHRYGGVPKDAERNPGEHSITELEYRRALGRGIPVYMFLMSDEHAVKAADVEKVEAYRVKLDALKTDARRRSITAKFSSVEELKSLLLQSMAELKVAPVARTAEDGEPRLPAPPDLMAVPDFISGHKFIGRRAELGWLDEWAASDDPMIVVEAIGGMGKSALAWHWMKDRAGFAGKLWYSFYEGGADMSAFTAYALAYTTGRPLKEFRGRHTADLAQALIAELHRRPFLLVLDGCERVLVAYHRFDASQARDDEVPADADHRTCTKPADAELLRQLVAATKSKTLVTSRLMPRVLTNQAHQELPGVRISNSAACSPTTPWR